MREMKKKCAKSDGEKFSPSQRASCSPRRRTSARAHLWKGYRRGWGMRERRQKLRRWCWVRMVGGAVGCRARCRVLSRASQLLAAPFSRVVVAARRFKKGGRAEADEDIGAGGSGWRRRGTACHTVAIGQSRACDRWRARAGTDATSRIPPASLPASGPGTTPKH